MKRDRDAGLVEPMSSTDIKHTRFDSDEDETRSQLIDLNLEKGSMQSCSVLTSATMADLEGESYVLDLALNETNDALAVGSSNGVFTYHFSPSRLEQHQQQQAALLGPVTAVKFPPEAATSLYACSGAGDVICWDLRQKQECQRYSILHRGLRRLPDKQLQTYILLVGTYTLCCKLLPAFGYTVACQAQ